MLSKFQNSSTWYIISEMSSVFQRKANADNEKTMPLSSKASNADCETNEEDPNSTAFHFPVPQIKDTSKHSQINSESVNEKHVQIKIDGVADQVIADQQTPSTNNEGKKVSIFIYFFAILFIPGIAGALFLDNLGKARICQSHEACYRCEDDLRLQVPVYAWRCLNGLALSLSLAGLYSLFLAEIRWIFTQMLYLFSALCLTVAFVWVGIGACPKYETIGVSMQLDAVIAALQLFGLVLQQFFLMICEKY